MFRGLRSTAPPLIQPSTIPTIARDCGLCRAFGLELGFSDSRTRRTADLYTLYSEQIYDASSVAFNVRSEKDSRISLLCADANFLCRG